MKQSTQHTGRQARLFLKALKEQALLHGQQQRQSCGHCHNCHVYSCSSFYRCPGHCCWQCPRYCGHKGRSGCILEKELYCHDGPGKQHDRPALQLFLQTYSRQASRQLSLQTTWQSTWQSSCQDIWQDGGQPFPQTSLSEDLVPRPAFFPAYLPSYLVLPLSCLCLAIILLLPGTASASYEEHLAGTILSRQAVAPDAMSAAMQPESPPASGQPLVPGLVPKAEKKPAGPAGLEEHGKASPVRTGMAGSNVPLKKALTLLIPPGWTCTGTVPQGPAVSWKKGENWHEVLRRAALQQNVHMTLDWQDKSITICQASGPASGSDTAPASKPDADGSKTDRPRETRPGDPGIISLAPLAPPAGKAQPKAADSSSPDTNTGTSHDTSHGASAKPADPVSDALASARKESSPATPAASRGHTDRPDASRPAAMTGQTARQTAPSSSGQDLVQGHKDTGAKPSGQYSGGSASLNATAAPAQASAGAASPAKAHAEPVAEYWQIGPGSLRLQLAAWAQRKGTALVWKPDTDLDLETGACFEGTFEQAVQSLFEGLKATGSPYTARLYKGNNVLIVEDR